MVAASSAPVRMAPAAVADRLFGVDMWLTSQEILASVFRPRSRTAVKACHASSKTHTAAIALALALYEGADVLSTAPTWVQVKNLLWGEVHRLLLGSVIPLPEWGDINQTEITMSDGSHALGISTNEGVNFQGWHARPGSFLLFIGDEAPGIRPDIFEAVEGISAGGDVRHLLLGNPVIASGAFFDIFSGSSPLWRRYTIDAFDTPNLAGLTVETLMQLPEHELDNNPRPYLVDRRWVRDRYLEWGEDHPLWQSRVRGRFPLQADDALISLAWLEEAGRHEGIFEPEAGPLTAGIDVAGPGEDETALWVRQGRTTLEITAFAQADARGPVVERLKHWLHFGLSVVNVDSIGQGHYFAQHLRDVLPKEVTVREINVAERPTSDKNAERYANLKAELYWGLREQFRDGEVVGLQDQTAVAQLASIRYEHDSRGRIVIESKDKALKRGAKSPDRAEAGMLAYAPEDPRGKVRHAYRDQAQKPKDERERFFAGVDQRRRAESRKPWGMR